MTDAEKHARTRRQLEQAAASAVNIAKELGKLQRELRTLDLAIRDSLRDLPVVADAEDGESCQPEGD